MKASRTHLVSVTGLVETRRKEGGGSFDSNVCFLHTLAVCWLPPTPSRVSPTFPCQPVLQSPADEELLAPPARPSYGAVGRTIQLRANHFQVKIPNCVLYHYDISIVPDKCPRRVNREIIDVLVKTHGDYFANQMPVFDGRKNLYSRKPLPIGRDRVRLA